MRVTVPTEARDSASRALIDGLAREIERLRARVVKLERDLSQARRELTRLGLPEVTQAWE